MNVSAIIALIVSILKAIPAAESLFRNALSELDKAREREAAERKQAKDAAVDARIDAK